MDLEEAISERVFNAILVAIRLLKEDKDIGYIAKETHLSNDQIQLLSDKLGIN